MEYYHDEKWLTIQEKTSNPCEYIEFIQTKNIREVKNDKEIIELY